jgi:hypothetical protein
MSWSNRISCGQRQRPAKWLPLARCRQATPCRARYRWAKGACGRCSPSPRPDLNQPDLNHPELSRRRDQSRGRNALLRRRPWSRNRRSGRLPNPKPRGPLPCANASRAATLFPDWLRSSGGSRPPRSLRVSIRRRARRLGASPAPGPNRRPCRLPLRPRQQSSNRPPTRTSLKWRNVWRLRCAGRPRGTMSGLLRRRRRLSPAAKKPMNPHHRRKARLRLGLLRPIPQCLRAMMEGRRATMQSQRRRNRSTTASNRRWRACWAVQTARIDSCKN